MYLWPILALICAVLEVIAVSKNLQRLEYFAKPAVMICLFLWLYSSTALQGNAFWCGLGILFSLAGDVLLISFDKMFLLGLIAFLLAHISYVTGFREEIVTVTAWSLILAVFIAINIGRLLRRIVGAMRAKGQNRLVIPVIAYGTVISVMLYAACQPFTTLPGRQMHLFSSAWEPFCFVLLMPFWHGINSSLPSRTEGYGILRCIIWDSLD